MKLLLFLGRFPLFFQRELRRRWQWAEVNVVGLYSQGWQILFGNWLVFRTKFG